MIEDKYYLSERLYHFFLINSEKQQALGNGFRFKPLKPGEIAHAITTKAGGRMDDNFVVDKGGVRKLTPKECWRLMGIKDSDYEKAAKVMSDTQLYKQAGNTIVKDVLMQIFEQLIDRE